MTLSLGYTAMDTISTAHTHVWAYQEYSLQSKYLLVSVSRPICTRFGAALLSVDMTEKKI